MISRSLSVHSMAQPTRSGEYKKWKTCTGSGILSKVQDIQKSRASAGAKITVARQQATTSKKVHHKNCPIAEYLTGMIMFPMWLIGIPAPNMLGRLDAVRNDQIVGVFLARRRTLFVSRSAALPTMKELRRVRAGCNKFRRVELTFKACCR